MKKICGAVAVALVLFSTSAFAASFDGTYKFSSRTKDGALDMQGWQGTMTIKGTEMDRTYKSPDGTQQKSYTSTFKQDGDLYILRHTKAYKPEYVGNEFRNRINLNGQTLTMEGLDGKFKETWAKQ